MSWDLLFAQLFYEMNAYAKASSLLLCLVIKLNLDSVVEEFGPSDQ